MTQRNHWRYMVKHLRAFLAKKLPVIQASKPLRLGDLSLILPRIGGLGGPSTAIVFSRKHLTRFIWPVLIGCTCLLTIACQPDGSSPTPVANCRSVQHAMGETCIPQTPERIVTLTMPALANLIALGIQPVGTATYGAFYGITVQPYLQDKVDGIDWVGSNDQPNLEKLIQLNPDLILGIKKQHEPIYKQLSQIAPTVLFELEDRSQWQQLVLDLGAVLDHTPAAEKLLRTYGKRVSELREQLGEQGLQQEVSIAYVMGGDIYSEATNSFSGSILADVGLRRSPAQERVDPNNDRLIFSQERIDTIDGDVLFVPKSGNQLDQDQDAFMQKPLWQTLKAVQQGRVYRVNLWDWTGLDILAAHEVLDDLFKYLVIEE
ncbi:ABC transporter substrate-binding protein [Leptolyngbya sp. Heron Island J]|uniref:ABC transporter substrate-binding protein n=1 Tax=Leptolyngbya sp. Heron Island J TaxID=1385935 RepID=UPI0009DE5234|nr:iron-siderophore ABC transporter substrate-binding protein [Leptolyngbya sp. Heron Island J]